MGVVNELINETLNENFDLGAFKKYLDGSLSGILKDLDGVNDEAISMLKKGGQGGAASAFTKILNPIGQAIVDARKRIKNF